MAIGLSTYCLYWHWHQTAETPLTWRQLLDRTQAWGCDLFQFCDYPPLREMQPADLRAVADYAAARGIRLELGTRGLDEAHLRHYLSLAQAGGVSLIRGMVQPEERPQARQLLERLLPAYERAGVTLALETYEQIRVTELVQLVDDIDSEYLGICLDPANSVAALDLPADTIRVCSPYVVNLHVKDFAFRRQEGWVGFTYTGAPLGEGLLDYADLVSQVRPTERGINQIVEHWLPWQGTSTTTCDIEDAWTQNSLDYLRTREGTPT
ncbi:MAG: sugar phosphate isomerase/epimerase family protein [Propioniciclava sp.]